MCIENSKFKQLSNKSKFVVFYLHPYITTLNFSLDVGQVCVHKCVSLH